MTFSMQRARQQHKQGRTRPPRRPTRTTSACDYDILHGYMLQESRLPSAAQKVDYLSRSVSQSLSSHLGHLSIYSGLAASPNVRRASLAVSRFLGRGRSSYQKRPFVFMVMAPHTRDQTQGSDPACLSLLGPSHIDVQETFYNYFFTLETLQDLQ